MLALQGSDALVDPICKNTCGYRAKEHRTELSENEQSNECGRPGANVKISREHEVLHPRADVGHGCADEQYAKVTVLKRGPGGARSAWGTGGAGHGGEANLTARGTVVTVQLRERR